MYLLFSFVTAAVFAQGGGNGGGNGGSGPQPVPVINQPQPVPVVNNQLGETCTVEREKPLDVMFLIDGSGSIGNMYLNDTWAHLRDPSAWPGQLRFIKTLIESSLTVEGDRVGIWQFASDYTQDVLEFGRLEFALGTPIDNVLANIMNMEHHMGMTPTKEAINVALNQFNNVQQTEEDRDRLMVIVTDGYPTCIESDEYTGCHDPCHDIEGNPITYYVDKLEDNEIRTVIIGVDNDAEMLQCLVEDPEENIVKITDFHSFQEYRDPTADDEWLCVSPEELKLECCRASVFAEDTKNMYDGLCRQHTRIECIHRRGTILGSCEWGIDTEGKLIDGCGVYTSTPTAEPTSEPTPTPTFAPTRLVCEPIDNCVVKGGEKVFGWTDAGGRMKASDACACAERCESEGGSESKWHSKRKICKCWKQSTHIELKYEPFDVNAQHGVTREERPSAFDF